MEFFDQMLQNEDEIDKMLFDKNDELDLLAFSINPDQLEKQDSNPPFSFADKL